MPVDTSEMTLETQPMFTDTYCSCPNRNNNWHEKTCIHSPAYRVPKPSSHAGKRAWRTYERRITNGVK